MSAVTKTVFQICVCLYLHNENHADYQLFPHTEHFLANVTDDNVHLFNKLSTEMTGELWLFSLALLD